MERRSRRYFTVEEARALVPRLRDMLLALQSEKRELDRELNELRRIAPLAFLNGSAQKLQAHEERIATLVRAIR